MLDPEFSICRQIHMIVIVFHVQGLLDIALYSSEQWFCKGMSN